MFVFNTHFDLVKMGSPNPFVYQKMALMIGSLWFCLSTYLLPVFRLIIRYLFRYPGDNISMNNSNSGIPSQENNLSSLSNVEPEEKAEADAVELDNSEHDKAGDEDKPGFCFTFRFQTYEEFSKSSEVAATTSTNKYEFMSGKGFSRFVEEPEVESCSVEELFADSLGGGFDAKRIPDNGIKSKEDFVREPEAVREGVLENSTESSWREKEFEKLEAMASIEDKLSNSFQNDRSACDEVQFLSENDFYASDSDSESIDSSREFSVMSHLIDSNSDGFLSDKDFGGAFKLDSWMDIDGETVGFTRGVSRRKQIHFQNSSTRHELEDFDEEDRDILEELQKLEQHHMQNSGTSNTEFLFAGDSQSCKAKTKHVCFAAGDAKPLVNNSEETDSQASTAGDTEDPNGLETEWEHQELIEQLKMELKKVRATGLPTILEESESPKIMEDLKPWKIDEKFQHEDRMDVLHKFYKSYRERVRKLDILNYQKMYALGFLQLEDPLQSISSKKSPAVMSFLSKNFGICRRKKIDCDPTKNFIRELYSDLEMVYVGQLCLSWEFLHWQYEKALELWESDPHRVHQYNEVAGEFQQFQVLMQRFIENEPFQGPRVQNYVKNRCILRNLLQVPVIREDGLKNGKKVRRRARGHDAITSDSLVEIMEESIRIFWRFVRADKHATIGTLNSLGGTHVELQDQADSGLLMEIRTHLHKKEKRLKDLLRTGDCILKKFQKHRQEDNSDQVLYFFSQVDMKLVSRVLNMSRITTDQLAWCSNKLSKISFVSRKKIHVEPSFLLFPC